MPASTPQYSNPRIDGHNLDTAVADGRVRADPAKLAWVGAMLLGGTVGSALTYSHSAVALFVITTGVTLCLGHSLGMHRRLIHRSYDCPRWLEYLFVHLGVLIGLSGPLGMLRTHDTRGWAQRQPICHNYYAHGEVWYRDLWWQVFCSISHTHPPRIEIEPQISNDRVYQFMQHTWMLQQLPWAVLFFYVGGWGWVFWGICSRVTISVGGHWLIGYFAHNGADETEPGSRIAPPPRRTWHVTGAAVQGHNVPWTALLTMGESWHNNHHAFPGSARFGLEDGQWDPGWWVLRGLQRMGLARNIIEPDAIATRAELVRLT